MSAPTDVHEQEADRVAHEVMGQRDAHASPRIHENPGGAADARPSAGGVDRGVPPGGRPLDPSLREDMERRFSHDFSRVRIHSGVDAEQSAANVTADAYTIGHDIVFGAGKYAPGTAKGQRLIAHELTHVVQSGRPGMTSQGAVLMRQPAGKDTPAPQGDVDPCTVELPDLPSSNAADRKQRQGILKDMLRGTTADEQRAWCKGIRRAMAAFSTSQLAQMNAVGVRFWRPGEFPPPFSAEYGAPPPGRTELARYTPETRVIHRGATAGVDEIRHELAHAWDHVRNGKVRRLDNVKGRELKKAVTAPVVFSSETSKKRLTTKATVGGKQKNVGLSVKDMFDRFMERPPRSGEPLAFANSRTDPDHVLKGVKEFYAEGYSVFHGGNEDAQALLLCDAPELYQMFEEEATKAKLPVPDRAKLMKNNTDNKRTCG